MLVFLKKHYEKILLTAFLIFFIISLVWQIHIIMTAIINPEELKVKEAKADYTQLDFKNYNAVDNLGDAPLWKEAKPRKEISKDYTDLVIPIKAARCTSCGRIIPETNFTRDKKCSWCGATLEELKFEDRSSQLDSDSDGIPDKVEMELELDPKNPNDIYEDKDNDGYPNIYEYKTSKTNMNDAKSRPLLVYRLIVVRIKRYKLPIMIKSVKTNSTDDKSKWLIQAEDLKKRRTRFLELNKEVKVGTVDYKITNVEFREKEKFVKALKTLEKVDASIVTLEKVGKDGKVFDDPVKAEVNKTVYEPKEYVELKDYVSGKKYKRVSEGDILTVGNRHLGTERYMIISVVPHKRMIKVKQVEPDGKISKTVYDITTKSMLAQFEHVKRKETPDEGMMRNDAQPPMDDMFKFKSKK